MYRLDKETLDVMEIIDYIANLGCSLKSLHLSFEFRNTDDFEDVSMSDKMRDVSGRIASDKNIPKAVAGLRVERQIEIFVDSNLVDDCEDL